jgi:polyisoprenoid-binding protein YceI
MDDIRRKHPAKAGRRTGGIALALLALVALAGLAEDASTWQVTRADVRVVCPLNVGGSFEVRTSSLAGAVSVPDAPGSALGGDLTVPLTTLDTGIGLRNDHLRNEYLEVGRGDGFDRAVLSDIRLGDVDPHTFQGRTKFTATLALHGQKRPVSGDAEVRRDAASTRVLASFPVTLEEYGIAKPQYLGVGVKSEVQIKVSLVASRVGSPNGGS